MHSKQIAVDREYKQIKESYEKDVPYVGEIYDKLKQESELDVNFTDINIDEEINKISVNTILNTENLDIKTLKYGWYYSDDPVGEVDSSDISNWTYVENLSGENNIKATTTYLDEQSSGYYYLCFVVNNKEYWTPTRYVSGDLILHLDAINNMGTGDSKHSNNTTTWYDLSGNENNATVFGIDNTAESGWHENYLALDGENDYAAKTGIIVNKDNGTVEVIAKYISGRYMFRSSANQRTYIEGNRTVNGNPFGEANFNTQNRLKLASRVIKWYKKDETSYALNYYNINKSKEYTFTSTESGDFISIGSIVANEGRELAQMDTYAVRVYNRALTETEIKHNYLMDKARFHIEE